MRKISVIAILAFLAFAMTSCGTDAEKVSRAINYYCDVVEDAIEDDLVDDGDVLDIRDAQAEYMNVISSATERCKDNPDKLSKFQQEMFSDAAWIRMQDVNAKLANTEGYVKISLTE